MLEINSVQLTANIVFTTAQITIQSEIPWVREDTTLLSGEKLNLKSYISYCSLDPSNLYTFSPLFPGIFLGFPLDA